MKKPVKKDFTTPFDGNLVMFDFRGYTKAMDEYMTELESTVKWAVNCIHRQGIEIGNIGDAGDQALQALELALKDAAPGYPRVLEIEKGTYGSNKFPCLWLTEIIDGKKRPTSEYMMLHDMDFSFVYSKHLKPYLDNGFEIRIVNPK